MRSKIAWRRWRSRLIAWSLVLALVVLAVVAVFIYMAYQKAAAALVIERDRQVTYLSAARLKAELSSYSDLLSTLARTPEIYRSNVADQRAALRQARNRLTVFDSGVVLLDNFGKVQATEPERPDVLGNDWSDRDFFRGLLTSSSVIFSDTVNDGPNGSPVVVISVPVLGEKGEFVGALAGMFGLGEPQVSAFYASIVRLRIGQSGNTYVIDGTGKVLYDSSYSQVGQTFDGHGLPPAALAGETGASRTRDEDGYDIVEAHAPVPETRWMLVTEDDWATLTSSTRRYARSLLFVLALGMVLPALGVALLVRERHTETLERERTDQEMRVASLIQRSLLPRQAPLLPGWNLVVHHQPAREAGGDFHDFLLLPDGRLMLTLGEIADRDVPAALTMATTRATLHAVARSLLPPCQALEQSNDLLCPEMPPGMSVACLYCILDPSNGRLEFANAGYLMPLHCGNGNAGELDVSGSPLGLRLGTEYEQSEVNLNPGERVIFCSVGLVKAHNSQGETLGLPRLQAILGRQVDGCEAVAETLMSELSEFTGRGWNEEEDITVIVLERMA